MDVVASLPVGGPRPTAEAVTERLLVLDAAAEVCVTVMVHGCAWSLPGQEPVWMELLDRLLNLPESAFGYPAWVALREWPAVLVLYAGGLAAVASGHDELLQTLLTRPLRRSLGPPQPLDRLLTDPAGPMGTRLFGRLPGLEHHPAAASEYLFWRLAEPLERYCPDEQRYRRVFDRFEYLSALIQADRQAGRCYLGRLCRRPDRARQAATLGIEIAQAGSGWPLLAGGGFGGDLARLVAVKRHVDRQLLRPGEGR